MSTHLNVVAYTLSLRDEDGQPIPLETMYAYAIPRVQELIALTHSNYPKKMALVRVVAVVHEGSCGSEAPMSTIVIVVPHSAHERETMLLFYPPS